MDNRRRRTRTGCLTCRARRVKCDERNPTCERCEAANIQCAGYERQRRVELPRRKRTRSVSDGSLTEQETNAPSPTLRADGLPLVCLPNSPDLTQRPHERARDILAYHQFLFRTVDTLFSPGDLYFWRDRLCGETWETEYIYDAIISLGNMHRAVVMLSQHNEIDQSRGMDTKVIAVRNYTRALEGLSENLEQAKTSVSLLVGVLVLLAYFECFNGNLPAAFRHTRTAGYYFHELCSALPAQDGDIASIESSLRDLETTLRTALPMPGMATFNRLPTTVFLPDSTSDTSQYLLHIAADDEELHNLIWNPAGPYLSNVSRTKIVNFHNMLIKWKNRNSPIFSRFDNEDCLRPGKITYRMLDQFTFPPHPHSNVTEEACLTLSLYTFYNMRLMWALSICGDRESSELNTYYFLYQCLRFVTTFLEICTSSRNNRRLMCESIKSSVATMLHVAGHCCPNPRWVRWTVHTLKEIGSHGLFDGNAFATNLDILLTLERLTTNSALERYRCPSQRAVSVLFPRAGGKDFLSYYGGPNDSVGENCLLGIATWSKDCNSSDTTLDLVPATHAQPFNFEWLSSQAVVKEWMNWAQNWKFDLNRALADHISGSTWS